MQDLEGPGLWKVQGGRMPMPCRGRALGLLGIRPSCVYLVQKEQIFTQFFGLMKFYFQKALNPKAKMQ